MIKDKTERPRRNWTRRWGKATEGVRDLRSTLHCHVVVVGLDCEWEKVTGRVGQRWVVLGRVVEPVGVERGGSVIVGLL